MKRSGELLAAASSTRLVPAGLVCSALAIMGCSGPTFVVSRPVSNSVAPCAAPPLVEPSQIFAGVDSALPVAEGGLRLVASSFDDRLTSPSSLAVEWGDDGRLLTLERDRVTIWEIGTGRAVSSIRLPARIEAVNALTATRDLSRAAAMVRVRLEGDRFAARLLALDVASGESRLFEVPRSGEPFTFSSDGASFIAGGDVWDAATWSHRRTVLVDVEPWGKPLPHPRRTDLAMTGGAFHGSALLPVASLRLHERVLADGPRVLRYLEPFWDARADTRSAVLGVNPGWVSTSPLEPGAPEMKFSVSDPNTIVVLSPNGRFVGTLATEFTLRSAVSPEPRARIDGTGWANRALLSDDGRVAILSYEAPIIAHEEARTFAEAVRVAHGPQKAPRLEAWDLETGKLLWRDERVLPDAARLTHDGRYFWQPTTSEVVDLRAGHRLTFGRAVVSISPSDIALLGGDWGGTTVVDLRTDRVVLAPKRRSEILAVSPDGRHFATVGPDRSLQLESQGSCARILPPTPSGYVGFVHDAVVFSADSSTLVAKTYGNYLLRAWDAGTGTERYAVTPGFANVELLPPLREIRIVASSPLPLSASTPDVTLLDVRTGERVAAGPSAATPEPRIGPLPSTTGLPLVTATGISPDGKWSATADEEGELTLTRTADGVRVGRADFAPRHDFVRFLWFPDARRVAAQTARGGVFEFSFEAGS